MFNRRNFTTTLSGIVLSMFAFSMSASTAFAQDRGEAPPAPNAWGEICTYLPFGDVATLQGLQCLIGRVLMIAVSGIGFAGFVMVLIGAFKYIMSGDNSKGVDDAKNTITFAIAGLVVALSAFFVLNIIAEFTGVRSILNFQIPNFAIPGQ